MSSELDRREFLLALGAATGTVVASPSSLLHARPPVKVVDLTVDHLKRPMGLDNPRPQLSWRLESSRRGARQSAYRIRVASGERALQAGQGDLWDSGKVHARGSLEVRYQGRKLRSRQRCWWSVQVWDEAGSASAVSETNVWEMGLLAAEDWTAQWLAADDALAKADRDLALNWIWSPQAGKDNPLAFRRHFTLPVSTRGGVLYTFGRQPWAGQVTGMWLDGHPLGAEIPVNNLIGERIELPRLPAGEHCLAVAANSNSSLPEAFLGLAAPLGIAMLARFDGEDGQHLRVGSAPAWKSALPADAEWHLPGYDDRSWSAVTCEKVEEILTRGPGIHLRRPFTLDQSIVSARLYASALGAYEPRLNGRRVGDALLTPEETTYEKRILYQTYDVTGYLERGANVLGLIVGEGWYRFGDWGPPPCRVIAQLELTLADGTRQVIGTDPSWRLARNALLHSGFPGEFQDARLEPTGWDSADFDERTWQHAEPASPPSGRLRAQSTPPIRVIQLLKPQSISSPAAGIYVVDFGQDFAGWCRLRVKGAIGTRVDLHYAEELTATGELDEFVMLGGKASDTYILRGDFTEETFEPHFNYHGFRYVQITGLPTAPTAESVTGMAISTDLEVTGQLRIDNPLIQRLWQNTVWAQRSNFVGNPLDSSNRNDIVADTGDLGVFWETATFNMNVAAVTRREMDNMRDGLSASGVFPHYAPCPPGCNDAEEVGPTPAWTDMGIILPWTHWRQYGDREVIHQNWAAMDRTLHFIHEHNPDFLWTNKRGDDYGDWEAIGDNHLYHADQPAPTPLDLIATAYWAYSTSLLAQMAVAIGRKDDAARLRAGYERIRAAFIRTFVKADGQIGNASQTSYVLALQFGLVPELLRETAAEKLVRDIRKCGVALSTGILGTRFIFDVLAETGYGDVVYSLLLRTQYPSWGDQIARGATAFWERWDGDAQHLYNEGSHNHVMFGSVGGFLYRRIAGIEAAAPGFEIVAVRPLLDPRVRRAGGDYDSVMGRISTDWEQHDDGSFSLQVTIPASATGRIHLPARPGNRIREARKEVSGRGGIRVVSRNGTEAIVNVGSGTYQFRVDGL